jgi:hypothetical protein
MMVCIGVQMYACSSENSVLGEMTKVRAMLAVQQVPGILTILYWRCGLSHVGC